MRVRMAPSPTGNLHIGTARTALFNFLAARRYKGTYVLRIEDTDLERSDKKYEKDIFDGLRWLNIVADESPESAGPFAPYRQTERTERYKPYVQQLLDKGKAFYCFHSSQELEKEKEELMKLKKPVLHLCEYRSLGGEEAEILKEAKQSYVIRFKTQSGRIIKFKDIVRGDVSFESDLIGDFSIAKRVDVPLYNFAVVVDDETMEITHVIRGEDHIANTPKQMLIIEGLGFKKPQYAHLPLILGPDRSKLSKRHGTTSINDYRQMGYLPEALVNFLALLGWNPGTDQELFTIDELIEAFSLEKIQKSGAIFDITKLDWMNGHYIRQKSVHELTTLCIPYLQQTGFIGPNHGRDYIEKIIALEQPRLKKLSEITERVDFFFRMPEYDKDLLKWKDMTDEEVKSVLTIADKIISDPDFPDSQERMQEVIIAKIAEHGLKNGTVLWPLRVALTGKKASPGPFEILEILGAQEARNRISAALAMF